MRISILLLIAFTTVGLQCAGNSGPAKAEGQSHVVPRTPDTQDEWELFKLVMDSEIRNEVAGRRAPGGPGRTWNERWMASIVALQKTHENYQRYTDYIVTERRKHGLPELQPVPE